MIFDNFFTSPNENNILTHEVVHCADFGRRISLSPDWIKTCNPLITKLRFRASLLDYKLQEKFGAILVKNGIWPSLYGCNNTEEALAEYVSLCFSKGKETHFSELYGALVHPTQNEREMEVKIRAAELAFASEQFSKARLLFQRCPLSESGYIELKLGACEFQLNNYGAAQSYFETARRKLGCLNLAPDEPIFLDATRFAASCSAYLGDMHKAKLAMDNVLLVEPFYARARSYRATCESHLGLTQAEQEDDRLEQDTSKIFPISAAMASTDLPFVHNLFDFLIEKGGDATRYAAIRAKLYADIARYKHDPQSYTQALDYLHSSLTSDNRHRAFLESELAQLSNAADCLPHKGDLKELADFPKTDSYRSLENSTVFSKYAHELFPISEDGRAKLIYSSCVERNDDSSSKKALSPPGDEEKATISEDSLFQVLLSDLL